LLWSDGQRRVDIRAKLACNDAFVSRWTAAFVKGCRTPARARSKASIGTGFRAGVGQASREETAAHATVVVEGWVAMAIGAALPG
jgi:hypothetical protein